MGYTARGPPALFCRRAQPQVSCPDPCSPTRYPDRPTAHATSSRQAPATLTGPRPCYSGHVTPQALPPSVGRGFRPPRPRPRALSAAHWPRSPGLRPLLVRGWVPSCVCSESGEQVVGASDLLSVYCRAGFWKRNLQREPNSV